MDNPAILNINKGPRDFSGGLGEPNTFVLWSIPRHIVATRPAVVIEIHGALHYDRFI
jgi:hypothetical protein